ncbi:MAG: type II/IV secretion system ATPase subunit [Candidatus Aenigmarchaeota archaeon]|nr:type II/IV secretion system ATPase subunit [Candidatus Aenigmarchaeota archaeon]
MKILKSSLRKMVTGYKAAQKDQILPQPDNPIPKPVERQQDGGDTSVQKIQIVKESTRTDTSGFEIPKRPKSVKIGSLEDEQNRQPLSLTYPLIPRHPEKDEPVFAYTRIYWDATGNRYIYELVEPKLSDKLKEIYKKVKEMLEQKLDIDFSKLKKIEANDFLDKQIDDVLKYFNVLISSSEKKILKYYMDRDFTGLETIEPLLQDPGIEDISCDGVGIPIFIFHRNPDIGSVPTNVMFDSSDELDSFIIRLAQLSGKSISISQPLLDGTLPDGSRIQATLGTDIARRGSNFTIRKFTEEPLTPVDLINYNTLDSNILAFLWFTVDYGRSILVSGGTASGKTSMLNVLSLFIRPEKKIISIEDTGELRLPHPHWVPVVARSAIGVEGSGEVDMFELLKESLRQRPDYIIVGEVRGKEAYILFQQMATGHPSLATIHAENMARLTDRLTTPPISLPAGLISSLDVVVFLARMKYKNKFVRKVTEVVELVDFDASTNTPVVNQIYKWNPQTDKFDITGKSVALKKISNFTGITEKEIKNEIERRIVVLDWMKENNILDYRDVHKVFSIYYSEPERLLSTIQGAG